MANGLNSIVKRTGEKMGSRRIFTAHFKLQVLDSYRCDSDCKGNQRATARKYGIHRRQIQKWLQAEKSLRTSVGAGGNTDGEAATLDCARQGGAHACVAISRDHVTTIQNGASTEKIPMDLTIKKSENTERLSTEVLDLTCRKRTHEINPVQEPPVKTVKLFKPYLLNDDDKDKTKATSSISPAIVTATIDPYMASPLIYPVYSYHTSYTYYQMDQQVRYSPCYDSASSFSPGSCYEEDYMSLSPDSESLAARQRHNYLDFNMAAVNNFYQRRQRCSPPLT